MKNVKLAMQNEKMKRRRGFTQHHFWLKNGARGLPSTILEDEKKSGAGFTLLELMVVIVIMGIVSTTVFLSSRGFLNKAAVKNATRDIASVMRIAHSKAVARKTNYLVVFDNQEPPDTQARVWVQDPRGPDGKPGIAGVDDDSDGIIDNTSEMGTAGSDDFNPDDPSTWKVVFGTERRLSKRVQIAGLSLSWGTWTDYQLIGDPMEVGYMTFYWNGKAIPMTVQVWDSTPQPKYKYSLTVQYSTSRVRIKEPD